MNKSCREQKRDALCILAHFKTTIRLSLLESCCSEVSFYVKYSLFAAGHRQHSSSHTLANKSNAQSLPSRLFPAHKHTHTHTGLLMSQKNLHCLQFYSRSRLNDKHSSTHHTLSTQYSRYSWNEKNAIKIAESI